MTLAELDQPVSRLAGIGPARARELAALGITTVTDLLLHVPRAYEDRRRPVSMAGARDGRPANTVVEVTGHSWIGRPPAQTLKVQVRDESASGSLVCFGRNFLAGRLPVGSRIRLYAEFARRYGELQASSFEFEPVEHPGSRFGRILPVYPLAGKLTQDAVRRATEAAVNGFARSLDDEIPESLRAARRVLRTSEALAAVHLPPSIEDAERGLRTLRYMELFFLQLGIGRRAARRRRSRRAAGSLPAGFLQTLLATLPFSLTADQRRSLEEIIGDLEADVPMARLLQGEVGSGKTIVSLLSAMPVTESGRQVALMAPTELLARQHADSATEWIARAGVDVRVALLSGTVPPSARRPLLDAVATGAADIVVGTQAVFTETVRFRNLRYVIIDEQHRFGVVQRLALLQKGREPDLLLMTATPIPRTLALTVFGDMKVSTIRSMPSGRLPVETHLARQENERKVHQFVRREIEADRQAYFIYPVIDGAGSLELRDAEGMWRRLKDEVFAGFGVGLLHSRLDDEEKRRTMERFRRGEIAVLVATSVVEVGVDVPNATCMVVEHAERFGLAALHQLRGRVGRGDARGYCFLLYDSDLTDAAKQRLKVMHETTDGFTIAEQDLRIRGPGDLAGTQQAGYLRLRVADVSRDMELMNEARADAFELLERDSELVRPEHRTLERALASAESRHRPTPFAYTEVP